MLVSFFILMYCNEMITSSYLCSKVSVGFPPLFPFPVLIIPRELSRSQQSDLVSIVY